MYKLSYLSILLLLLMWACGCQQAYEGSGVFSFEAEKNSTLLTLNVYGAGKFSEDTPRLVKQVWEHFLGEQFQPFIEEQFWQSRRD
jgi:hypothetical protein